MRFAGTAALGVLSVIESTAYAAFFSEIVTAPTEVSVVLNPAYE